MTNFIPDTDKTITLPVGMDFRKPGQPSPYRDKAQERLNQKIGYETLRNMAGQGLAGSPYVNGQAAQQLPNEWRNLLGLRP